MWRSMSSSSMPAASPNLIRSSGLLTEHLDGGPGYCQWFFKGRLLDRAYWPPPGGRRSPAPPGSFFLPSTILAWSSPPDIVQGEETDVPTLNARRARRGARRPDVRRRRCRELHEDSRP